MKNGLRYAVAKVTRLDNVKSLKGFVDVRVNDTFIIRNIKVINGKNGLFISPPSELGKDGKWHEIVTFPPEQMEERKRLQTIVLEAYLRGE